MDDNGQACLCDFGLSSLTANAYGSIFMQTCVGGTPRYAAPELFCSDEDEDKPLVACSNDVYSFGSVAFEVGA